MESEVLNSGEKGGAVVALRGGIIGGGGRLLPDLLSGAEGGVNKSADRWRRTLDLATDRTDEANFSKNRAAEGGGISVAPGVSPGETNMEELLPFCRTP